MKGERFFKGRRKKKEDMNNARVQAYPVSSKTLTIINNLKRKEEFIYLADIMLYENNIRKENGSCKKIMLAKTKTLFTFNAGHWPNCLSVRQWPARPRFNPRSSRTKNSKIVFDATLLNTQHHKVGVKWSNPEKGVVPSPTPWYSSYGKGSLRITFDYGCQLCFLLTTIL